MNSENNIVKTLYLLFLIVMYQPVCSHPNISDWEMKYCQTSNIRHAFVGNKLVDHSDVIGASPAGAAPTTSSFST